MEILRELYLVTRVLYTVLFVWSFSTMTGFGMAFTGKYIGWLIFLLSFMFQYYVFHYALNKLYTAPQERLYLLICSFLVIGAGFIVISMNMPSIKDINLYETNEQFIQQLVWWASWYSVCCASFIGLSCARRAYTRYGQLGNKPTNKR